MYKGLVDLKELRKNKDNADCRVINGYCFVIGNKLIKIYANQDDYNFIPLNREKMCDFSGYKADTIVFPDTYIKEKGEIVGEISDFINDNSILIALKYDTEINTMVKSYELVIKDLLTYSNIVMNGLCFANILYSNDKGFHIINTSEWQFGQYTSIDNKFNFDDAVVRKIIGFLDIPVDYHNNHSSIDEKFANNCMIYGDLGNNFLNTLELNLNCKYRFLDLMYLYKELYEKHYGEELKTLDDVKKYTKVLKKG